MSQSSQEKRKELASVRRKKRKAKVKDQVDKKVTALANRLVRMSKTIEGQQASLIALQKKNNELEAQLKEVTPFSNKMAVEETTEG